MPSTTTKINKLLQNDPHLLVTDDAYHLATLRHAPSMGEVIWEVKQALAKGVSPERSRHGISETYFLKNTRGKPIAVFKLKNVIKEYAAYRLDHYRFATVPPTVITTLHHPLWHGKRTGSCQLYVNESLLAVQFTRALRSVFSPDSIRRIATLDIRLINCDRNTSNLLVIDGKKVIPIDHGLVLPEALRAAFFIWTSWQQAATPFSTKEKAYIASLDAQLDRDILLQELRVEEGIANRMYIATLLLKECTKRHFMVNQIGTLMVRTRRAPSIFEILIDRLRERDARNWSLFTQYIHEEIDLALRKKPAT